MMENNKYSQSTFGSYDYTIEGNFIRCTVKSGRSFIFDADDLELVSRYSWSVDKKGYVIGLSKEGRRVKLHRVLMDNPVGVVDHINGQPWDCRRSNLRSATQHQNTQNCSLPKSSTTGYKGVCFDNKKQKYMAHIHPNGRMKFLGYYSDPVDAALAYDRAALFYFKSFAKTNFNVDTEEKSDGQNKKSSRKGA